jgi:hypothetical protein
LRRNCLVKHVNEGNIEGRKLWEDEEEEVSSYWTETRRYYKYWRRKH